MDTSKQHALFAAIQKLARPLVRILLRNGVPFGVFADLAKVVYVDVALKEFGIPGRKASNSRVSVITGLSRKEVLRVRRLGGENDAEAVERYNRAARVISGWLRDDRFGDHNGEPAPLPVEGAASFASLVQQYSGDVPARAILDELLASGAVHMDQDKQVVLRTRAYLPEGDEAGKLAILGTDVADLINTINHNLVNPPNDRCFQRKVSYDNVPEEAVAEFRRLSSQEGQQTLERLDQWLARRDRDGNPGIQGSGRRRVGVGIYYFEEDLAGNKGDNKK